MPSPGTSTTRGRAHLAGRRRLGRRDELGDDRRVVEGHDHAPLAREAAAQARKQVERAGAPRGCVQHRHARSAEHRPPAFGLGDGVLGSRDELDRRLVGLPDGGAPGDRAVLREQQRPSLGVGGDGVGDLARDLEARSAVVERDDVLAVDAGQHVGRAVVVRERDDGVGVGVHDRVGVDEAVQQRLDRGARTARFDQPVGEIGDHLLVAHVLPLEERPDVVHADTREVLALNRLEVGAAALDAQHGDLAPAVVALGDLHGRVAAAPDDQRGLGADQAGGVDEKIDAFERCGLGVVPARSHRAHHTTARFHSSLPRPHTPFTGARHPGSRLDSWWRRTLMTTTSIDLRSGAVALAVSALLFAAFPLVRPFFRLDVFSPTLAAVASGPLASTPWVVAHFVLAVAFALLPLGLLAVASALADDPAGARARRGAMLGIAGLGLVVPAVGVETFAMPVIGRLYLDGVSGVAPALAQIYRGPMTLVMLVGLLVLALGTVDLARAIWRSGSLPR